MLHLYYSRIILGILNKCLQKGLISVAYSLYIFLEECDHILGDTDGRFTMLVHVHSKF